jgi:hypothetical protein
MASRYQIITAAAVGGLMLLGICASASAQTHETPTGTPLQSNKTGSLQGEVHDENDAPVEGAIVTAIGGAQVSFVVTDRQGRFALTSLTPGSYMVRAHRDGFSSPQVQRVEVQPQARSVSVIMLRRAEVSYPTLAAGFGASPGQIEETRESTPVAEGNEPEHTVDAHTEVAWRVRNARRSVLKDAGLPLDVAIEDTTADFSEPRDVVGPGSTGSPASFTTNFVTDTPLSGQVNFLAAGSFDDPEELFSSAKASRGITYVRVGASVGAHGDWTMRGALTQADLSTWFLEGTYSTRAEGREGYDVGMSYSTQRYDGGNFLALRDVTDGSRNVGTLYAFDTVALNPSISVTYGGRYDRFDYLDRGGHLSPRIEVALVPAERVRVSAVFSRSAQAPGAEEFLPPGDDGVWMPPQRTFSPFEPARGFEAERTTHVAVTAERDFGASTVGIRAYRQSVVDQLVTMFGADFPSGSAANLGHYLVGNAGDIDAIGGTAEFRTAIADRFRGSVAYSLARTSPASTSNRGYLVFLAPSMLRADGERVHDVSTRLEADVPETSTRVLVLYRASTGFAHPALPGTDAEGPGIDSRFDVQVRQSLPFMSFYGAELEMLVAVRNFFKSVDADQSMLDELLVINPPKQIVGGVTLHF